jgi:dipeptidase
VPEAGPVWFAKNSDREPTEAQFLECHDGSERGGVPEGLPFASSPHRLLLSRPAWMWGCEMGVNEHGVAIGNEAVFTRLRVPKAGYTGMDFQRVALTGCKSAADALEQLIELTERFDQGGPMAHQQRSFRYHSSFIVADADGAWVFETAGKYWAAKRVRGAATISNALTIGRDFDRLHADAYGYARKRGWVKSANEFSFAGAFSDPFMSLMAGARIRRACTRRSLQGITEPIARDFVRALSDHGSTEPGKGLRSESPCAHAAWLPTKTSAQTTSSIIARLDANGPAVWGTGTSSPCLSVFKPAPFDPQLLPPRPVADARFDARELWWGHERLHRACLESYHERRVAFADDLERLQDECLQPAADPQRAWREHRTAIEDWLGRALEVKAPRRSPLTRRFWAQQARRTSIPG